MHTLWRDSLPAKTPTTKPARAGTAPAAADAAELVMMKHQQQRIAKMALLNILQMLPRNAYKRPGSGDVSLKYRHGIFGNEKRFVCGASVPDSR